MNRHFVICVLLLVVATGAMLIVVELFETRGHSLFRPTTSQDSSSNRPPIKAIMIRGFRDNNTSLLGRIRQALEANEIPWGDIQNDSEEIVGLAKDLETFAPAKGENESWKSLTGHFTQCATDLANAVRKKDREASKAECNNLAASCKACHKAHR
jgi:cytochrome c553